MFKCTNRLKLFIVAALFLTVIVAGNNVTAKELATARAAHTDPFQSSYANGYTHGQKYKSQIKTKIEVVLQELENEGYTPSELAFLNQQNDNLYSKVLLQKIAWMKGVAEATGFDYNKILLLNSLSKDGCTSFIAQGAATKNNVTIISKNRDLGAKSLNAVCLHERRTPAEETFRAAYIDIPQVKETYKFIGIKSVGRWGFGMGINEYQVTIADNDMASMDELGYLKGLHDNDYIRLALERAKTAREAVTVIGNLTEKFGQSWNGIAFEIGDPGEAWLMEVAGYRWVAKKYNNTVVAVANQFQLTDNYDLASEDLVSYAEGKGWITGEDIKNGKINFRKVYAAKKHYPDADEKREHAWPLYTSQIRQAQGIDLLRSINGEITVQDIIKFQRDHYNTVKTEEDETIDMEQIPFYSSKWKNKISYPRQICHHGIGGKTIASAVMVSKPNSYNEFGTMWTQLGQPCESTYIPFFVGATSVPGSYTTAEAAVKFESIRVRAFGHYKTMHPVIREVFDPFEKMTFQEVLSVEKKAVALLKAGKPDAAKNILTSFTSDKAARALKLVDIVQARMTDAAVDAQSWGEGR